MFSCFSKKIRIGMDDETTIKYNDTLPFAFTPPNVFIGKAIRINENIIVAAYLHYDKSILYRFIIKLNGIYIPDIEKAKPVLDELILNKTIAISNKKIDKYGQIFADIYVAGMHVNQYLIDQQLAMPNRL